MEMAEVREKDTQKHTIYRQKKEDREREARESYSMSQLIPQQLMMKMTWGGVDLYDITTINKWMKFEICPL